MKKNAFTFYEILIALIVFGIMVTLAIVTIKPEGIRESSLQKAGTAFRNVVQAATQKVLFDWSNDYKMTNLIDPSGSGSFSITDSEEEATPKLTALYKKFMRTRRSGSNKQCTMEFQGACIAYIEEVEGKGSREIKISTSGASAYGKDKSVFDGETIKASDASILSDYQNIDLHSKEGTVSMDGVSKISDFANYYTTSSDVYVGFKLFETCDKTVENVLFDPAIKKHSMNDVCGLIFYDINSTQSPNILGADEYILAIGKTDIK